MSEKANSGFVKSLLFPGYTDAGANDAYPCPNDEHKSEANAHDMNVLEELTTQSDATTAIHDNRAMSKPREHEMQYDGDREGGYAPSALTLEVISAQAALEGNDNDSSLLVETGVNDGVDGTEREKLEEPIPIQQDQQLASARTARFFPSTDPIGRSPDNTGPSSPPKMMRRKPPERGLSTKTHFGGDLGGATPKNEMPFPSVSPILSADISAVLQLGHLASLEEDSSSFKDYSSPSVEPASTEISGVASSVLGYHFLDRTQNDEEEMNPIQTPKKDNTTKYGTEGGADVLDLNSDSLQPITEAALRERDDHIREDDQTSDINSNLSEYGTVIEAPGRLAEVEAMAALITSRGSYDDQETLVTPQIDDQEIFSTSPSQNRSPFDEDCENLVVAALSLPTLETKPHQFKDDNIMESHSSSSSLKEGQHHTEGEEDERILAEELNTPSILSAAFRRLGSAVPEILSAPSTPQTTQSSGIYLSKSWKSKDEPPSSFLLRSPGSLAHSQSNQARKNKPDKLRFMLSPRVSSSSSAFFQKQSSGSTPRKSPNSPLQVSHSLPSPLRFARGCLSYDTSIDGPGELQASNPPPSPSSRFKHLWNPSKNQVAQTVRQSHSWDVGSAVSSTTPGRDDDFHKFASSAFRRGPGGGEGSRILHRGSTEFQQSNTNAHEPTTSGKFYNSPALGNSQNVTTLRTPHRIEIEREDALDILACLVERSVDFDQENDRKLASIIEANPSADSENKDGDNGLVVDGPAPVHDPESRDDDKFSMMAEAGGGSDQLKADAKKRLRHRDFSSAPDNTEVIRQLRLVSKSYEENQLVSANPTLVKERAEHSTRMNALDELLRSHIYAAEMKRIAMSASTWLQSIDRKGGEVEDRELSQQINNDMEVKPGLNDPITLEAMLRAARSKIKAKDEHAQRLNEELSECRAEIGRLKSSTRAEALPFMSPNRSILDNDDESSSSEDVSKADAVVERFDASPILKASGEASAKGYTSFDTSFCLSTAVSEKESNQELEKWEAFADAKRETAILKSSLTQANEVIERLYDETRKNDESKEHNDTSKAPVVIINNHELGKELDEYKEALEKAFYKDEVRGQRDVCSPLLSEKRSINVRMLDGENFVTEWGLISPPLPPPPDHDLRAPIVETLLDGWTKDRSMHDSLISWITRILDGADPEDIAPLTISSLNHQVRDGFAMHVLPLLLRRADIHVDVKTRAHRNTTYDMAVTISRSTARDAHVGAEDQSAPSLHAAQRATKKHIMAYKASHADNHLVEDLKEGHLERNQHSVPGTVSDYLRTGRPVSYNHMTDTGSDSVAHSTITTQITNASKFRPAPSGSDSVGSGVAVPTSISASLPPPQTGLMSTIGGAFGGLLSRRKDVPSSPVPRTRSYSADTPMSTADKLPSFLSQPPASPSHSRVSQKGDEDEQPYHRVVSAPPGRIGVTFVQYRGHAVVSDVLGDGPLSGWVFPNDILIAIDEVPVSGMRVRDIVQILTVRKERQRALRVISSQSMNEFTLNTTAPSEIGTSNL